MTSHFSDLNHFSDGIHIHCGGNIMTALVLLHSKREILELSDEEVSLEGDTEHGIIRI